MAMVQQDGRLGGSEKAVEVKLESASLSNKHLPQSYQSDPIADTFAAQPAVPRRTNLAHSKRSGTKSEVGFICDLGKNSSYNCQ